MGKNAFLEKSLFFGKKLDFVKKIFFLKKNFFEKIFEKFFNLWRLKVSAHKRPAHKSRRPLNPPLPMNYLGISFQIYVSEAVSLVNPCKLKGRSRDCINTTEIKISGFHSHVGCAIEMIDRL